MCDVHTCADDLPNTLAFLCFRAEAYAEKSKFVSDQGS